MNKFWKYVLLTCASLVFGACGPAADNKPAANNAAVANTNAAKPAPAPASMDALLALDKQANDAYFKSDSKFFDGFLNDKFVMVDGGKRVDKATAVKMIGTNKCEMKELKLEEPQMATVDADTAVLIYKATYDGTCAGPDGKQMKVPSPTRAATVWVRSGDKWQPIFHGENAILDPKAPPAAKSGNKMAARDDKAAANSNTAAAPAAPATSPNTDALVKAELAGWEAWKSKDAKKLEEVTAKNVAIVGGDGTAMTNKADIVKFWAEMPCENVKNVSVTDGFATALSPTVEMLTFNGKADGTCFGQKNGVQPSMSIYVKEGDAWKLAFGFSHSTM